MECEWLWECEAGRERTKDPKSFVTAHSITCSMHASAKARPVLLLFPLVPVLMSLALVLLEVALAMREEGS